MLAAGPHGSLRAPVTASDLIAVVLYIGLSRRNSGKPSSVNPKPLLHPAQALLPAKARVACADHLDLMCTSSSSALDHLGVGADERFHAICKPFPICLNHLGFLLGFYLCQHSVGHRTTIPHLRRGRDGPCARPNTPRGRLV